MVLVKAIRNGQITIPKALRTALGIEEGDLLEIRLTKAGMAIKPKVAVDKELAQEILLRQA
jgi:AbrB family looped-hinge helix DNA binding protein